MQFKVESRLVLREIINVFCNCTNRGINFILSALVFNIFPTIFEVLLVSGILVSFLHLEELAIRKKRAIWMTSFIIEYSSGDKTQYKLVNHAGFTLPFAEASYE